METKITLEQANEASKLLHEYVEQERKRISALAVELRRNTIFLKTNLIDSLMDLDGLDVRAYNGLKAYIRHYLPGVEEREAIYRIHRRKLFTIRDIGKKTVARIEEVFANHGIELLE